MEFNPSSIEKSDQIVWSSSDDHQVSGHVRSYKCAFCKKGFSNAQALGGHMNIHRRDRAKLKESSGDQSLLSEKTQSDHLNTSVDDESSRLESNKEKSFTHERPWIFSREDDGVSRGKDGVAELRQLHLFVDSPTASNDLEASNRVNEHGEKSKKLSHGSSSTELDLELRLGLEHREASTPGTREFF